VKKYIGFFLGLLMLWQIIGLFSYFEISQYKIRKEIKQVIKHSVPKDQLKVLYFSREEQKHIVWIKSHEFKYQGRLYDVIKRTITFEGIIFRCIDDVQETRLFEKLNQATSFNLGHGSDNNPLNQWMRFSQTLFLLENTDTSVLTSFLRKEEHIFYYQNLHKEWCKLPHSPPPEV
jgi:hypothetical protein